MEQLTEKREQKYFLQLMVFVVKRLNGTSPNSRSLLK